MGPVLGGMVIHPLSKAKEVLPFFHEFSSTAPDEVGDRGAVDDDARRESRWWGWWRATPGPPTKAKKC